MAPMLITNHVLAGAAIGAVFRRRPAAAFAAGIASHLIMDSLPHWGLPREPESEAKFLQVAYKDGSVGLGALITLAAGARQNRVAVLAGMAGATLLDVDKPAKHFFGRNPVPDSVQDFHDRIQDEAEHRMPGEFLVGAGLLMLAGFLVRRG